MRFVVPVILSIFISLGLFWGMQLMTSSNKNVINKAQETHELVYLRDKKETNIQKKKRLLKKKEIKKKIEKFKVVKKFHTKEPKQIKINPLKIQRNIEFSKIASLDGAKILLDANSLTPLKRVNPKYPRRAKMKKTRRVCKIAV
jgi:protein TonB